MKKNVFHVCALMLMVGYLVAIVVFASIDVQTVFEPKGLLPALNTLFTGLLPLAVAVIAARTYLQSGQFSVLCMGCGMLTFGLGAMVVGWLIRLPDGPNISVTIYNSSALCSSIFHVMGAAFKFTKPTVASSASTRKRIWLICYAGILIGLTGLTYAAVYHLTPPFFLQGVGPTPIRQAVLGIAILLYVFSAGVFLNFSLKAKSAFLYWYCVSLNMIAIGLLAVFITKAIGSPIGWLGRSAQYVGGLFALTAIISALRSAAKVGAPPEDIIASFFAEAETMYKNLVETATDAIISCDQIGKVLLWNAAAADLLGYTSQEAIGVSLFETILPQNFSALQEKIARMIALDQASSSEIEQSEVTSKDGRRVPVEFSVSLQKLPLGWVVTFIFRDITERKRAEDALRESEERYHLANHATFNAIWDWNLQTDALWWNENFQTLFGYRAEEIEPGIESWTNRIHPEDLARIETGIHAAIDTGRQSWSDHYRFRRKDGTFAEIDDRGYISRESSGKPVRMIGAMQDITERKRAEESLRESEDKFKYVFDYSVIGKSITRPSGEITVNQALCEMLGYTPEELRHERWQDITHPDDLDLTQREMDLLLAGEQASASFNKRYLHKDGSVVWTDVRSSLRRDQDGQPLYFMTTVNDITPHKRAEAERERLMTELAQKNKELEQLVYATSHDLRSPLVNVQGFSKELSHAVHDLMALLQSPDVPEHLRQKAAALVENDLQEDLHYILTSIAKMDTLLAGLLRLSRLGRVVLNSTTLDLNTLIADVLNTFEFQVQKAGVHVEVAELLPCQGDATQINQVFSNLIDNALKYRDPNRVGVIKIWGYTEQVQSIYCVEDNGMGIAPEHQQKIFELFHRLNPDHTRGEGLGLPIVRKILERQGGNVWVESEPGQGSKFYVSLPKG